MRVTSRLILALALLTTLAVTASGCILEDLISGGGGCDDGGCG